MILVKKMERGSWEKEIVHSYPTVMRVCGYCDYIYIYPHVHGKLSKRIINISLKVTKSKTLTLAITPSPSPT